MKGLLKMKQARQCIEAPEASWQACPAEKVSRDEVWDECDRLYRVMW
jgi:hypothetical protein